MPTSFRQALPRDASSLNSLYKELTEDPNVCVLPNRISQIRDDDNSFLFVITQRGSVKGSCFMTLCLDPMYQNQPYAVLENVIVAKQHRGYGVGSEILTRIEHFCIAKDVSKIMLLSSAKRSTTHAFLESHNYQGNIKKGFVKYISSFKG